MINRAKSTRSVVMTCPLCLDCARDAHGFGAPRAAIVIVLVVMVQNQIVDSHKPLQTMDLVLIIPN
jgi:hypothetical protein